VYIKQGEERKQADGSKKWHMNSCNEDSSVNRSWTTLTEIKSYLLEGLFATKRLWFSKSTGKDWHYVRNRVEKVRKIKLTLGKDGQYKREDPNGATLLHEISTASYTRGQTQYSYCIVEIQSQTLQPLPCLYPFT